MEIKSPDAVAADVAQRLGLDREKIAVYGAELNDVVNGFRREIQHLLGVRTHEMVVEHGLDVRHAVSAVMTSVLIGVAEFEQGLPLHPKGEAPSAETWWNDATRMAYYAASDKGQADMMGADGGAAASPRSSGPPPADAPAPAAPLSAEPEAASDAAAPATTASVIAGLIEKLKLGGAATVSGKPAEIGTEMYTAILDAGNDALEGMNRRNVDHGLACSVVIQVAATAAAYVALSLMNAVPDDATMDAAWTLVTSSAIADARKRWAETLLIVEKEAGRRVN